VLVGLIDNLAGHVELDAFLVPRAWTPGEWQKVQRADAASA